MKIRATIAATLAAPLLFVAAPANAADPETPPECDEAVAEWRERSAFYEGKFVAASGYLTLAIQDLKAEQGINRQLRTDVATLRAEVAERADDEAALRSDLAFVEDRRDFWQERAERRRDRIERLVKRIRALRNR